MPLSNSVIRCYTPPTCTLEIFAQSSPLSRWMGKTVLKHLSFELRFDDPRLPEENRVPIRGDRDQLEALCDAVTSYVQQFLQQSPENFCVSFSDTQESSTVLGEPELKSSTKTLNSFTTQIPGANIRLEPSSHLTHNLFLGSLANHSSGPVIKLSLLQLFDLASALDEYSTDVMALPTLNSPSTLRFPAWAPVAAVLVLGVGLLPVTWQYANNLREKQQQTAKTADPAALKTALETSPSLNFPTPQPGLTAPSDNLLGSTPPLSTSTLPQAPLTAPSSSFSTPPPNALTIPQGKTSTLSTNGAISHHLAKSQVRKLPYYQILHRTLQGQVPNLLLSRSCGICHPGYLLTQAAYQLISHQSSPRLLGLYPIVAILLLNPPH
ncbi:DUF4335 domain-containing protein [Nostoc sphaeroides]|uniref:DUF4335 domain-containing protein n=1 Tax=Nostoc sphaeroides TaxID=446679 RepID=UPI002B400181|nr:DUF4335 domain-containing protein [Nostoc sphaeroides]